MGLAAIYSRNDNGGFGAPPEVTLTMTQLGGLGPQLPGAKASRIQRLGNAPVIRDHVAQPLRSDGSLRRRAY